MKSRSKTPPPSRKPSPDSASHSAARDHYLREKARRAKRLGPNHELLAAARREYEALLEADAAKGKGGRPKKTARARKAADDEFDLEEHVGDAGEESRDHEDHEDHDEDAEEE